MDFFGIKKRKKEKNFNNEVNVAIAASLERFGDANAEHFKSYSALKNISKHKINPEFAESNYWQQAGFSSEIKNTARSNANDIINKNNKRIIRTDDVGAVNHPKFDHVETDITGNPLKNSRGEFINGSQQKNFKQIDSYRKLYGKDFEHYEDAILDVPSNQLNDIKADWNNQLLKLEKQKQNRIANDDIISSEKIQNRIDQIKDAKKRLRDSKVSTGDALNARKYPTISVGIDIAKISHKAGMENAKMGGTIGCGISSVKNVVACLNGDKSRKEAIIDVGKDTSKAAVTSYAYGASSTAVSGVLKSSSKQVLKNLGKGNAPIVIVQSGAVFAKQTAKLLSGEITADEFAKNITQETMTLGSSMVGSNLGAIIGTAIFPGAGTIVGGVIGGMAASMISGAAYAELKKSIADVEMSNQNREIIKKMCEELIIQERENREYAMSIYDAYFDNQELEIRNGFQSIGMAIRNGENINSGLAMVASAFDLQLKFENISDFENHIRSGKTLKL